MIPMNCIQLSPDMNAVTATRKLLLNLLDAIQANLAGTKEGLDNKPLHDFRVAIRRTRSVLGQLQEVFTAQDVVTWKQAFAWLGSITGATRDLDVFLSGIEEYRSNLPDDLQHGLEGFHANLLARQGREQEELHRLLSTDKFHTLLREWEAFLNRDDIPDRPDARQPVTDVIRERIWPMYCQVCEEGRAITGTSPDEDLHELRKSCKKLRYLMELFSNLFPEQQIRPLIDSLKRLLDALGDFNDNSVQRRSLEEFIRRMRSDRMASRPVSTAMDALGNELQRRHDILRLQCKERFTAFDTEQEYRNYQQLFAASQA
jgi:CHAD domain-containing protein